MPRPAAEQAPPPPATPADQEPAAAGPADGQDHEPPVTHTAAPETGLFVPTAERAAQAGENGAHQQADGQSG